MLISPSGMVTQAPWEKEISVLFWKPEVLEKKTKLNWKIQPRAQEWKVKKVKEMFLLKKNKKSVYTFFSV